MENNDRKVITEVAEEEFSRWSEAMDLDLDTDKMDAEDRTAFDKQKRRIVTAIERGNLVIESDGTAVFSPSRSDVEGPIRFNEPDGAALMAMDKGKKNHDVAKTYAVMGEITGLPAKTFARLRGSDSKVALAIFALLMD